MTDINYEFHKIISGARNHDINDNSATNEPPLPEIGKSRADKDVHIGCNIWIPELIYKTHFRINAERTFITTMCYELWGPEKLARRVVRAQKNVTLNALTPTKKAAVEELFNMWMKKKNLPPYWRSIQMRKINTYLNGAITAARKKINFDFTEENDRSENSEDEQHHEEIILQAQVHPVPKNAQNSKKMFNRASLNTHGALSHSLENLSGSEDKARRFHNEKKGEKELEESEQSEEGEGEDEGEGEEEVEEEGEGEDEGEDEDEDEKGEDDEEESDA